MRRFKNLVVGLDLDHEGAALTRSGQRALEQARWLAGRIGAGLTLFHSTHDRHTPQQGIDLLEGLAVECSVAGVPTATVVTEERPWLELIRRVLQGRDDFVIVGKRDLKPRTDGLVGSIARKLLRKCPAPILAVEPDHELIRRSVLIATDLTEVGERAVAFGAFFANQAECKLSVVHAWQTRFAQQIEAGRLPKHEVQSRREEIEQAALAKIRDALRRAEAPEGAAIAIFNDSPTHAIRREVDRLEADLVVMGTVSRGGIAGFLVGNTAERLIERIDCSLLTVKPADFVCPIDAN